MSGPNWLPELVPFDGDWNQLSNYIDLVYGYFCDDFVRRWPPPFQGARVSLRRHPEFEGKSASFWHLVTKGKIEESRYPVIERCERICWPRPVLEHAATDPTLHIWKNRRGSDQRMLIALPDFEYVVVLQERRDAKDGHVFFLLLTAYPLELAHEREKMKAECEGWQLATKG
jgi:hypothetical protein